MKLTLECSVCNFFKRQINERSTIPRGTSFNLHSTPDDNLLALDCPSLHSSITIIENHKFDLLFESGIRSLKNIYYREAVASFASSLERFYEYIINQILFDDVNFEEFNKSWKNVSNQSERQLGAFIFLHLNKVGKSPNLLHNNKVKFRNKVIHKGYFPTYEESFDFLKAVAENVNEIYNNISEVVEMEHYDNYLNKIKRCKAEEKISNYVATGPRAIGSEYKIFKRPFSRKLNTFFSNLNQIPIERIENYIEEINEYE